MRVLEHNVILSISGFLVLIIVIASINIFILVRFRRSKPVVLVHIASFFLLSALFCFLIERAILDLRAEQVYIYAGRLLIYLSMASYAVAVFVYLLNRNKPDGVITTDLRSVFITVDDLAVIADYNGRIIEVNHHEALSLLDLETDTLQNLLRTLSNITDSRAPADIAKRLPEMKEKIQAELMLCRSEQWYALSIYPIMSNHECLGYIMIMQDITYIKSLEAQLQAQNVALEEANRQLARDIHMVGILEAERQRLQVQEKVQSEILKHIEQAITDIGAIRTFYKDTGQICRDDAVELAERLRSIHKDVRKSIGVISGRSEALD